MVWMRETGHLKQLICIHDSIRHNVWLEIVYFLLFLFLIGLNLYLLLLLLFLFIYLFIFIFIYYYYNFFLGGCFHAI